MSVTDRQGLHIRTSNNRNIEAGVTDSRVRLSAPGSPVTLQCRPCGKQVLPSEPVVRINRPWRDRDREKKTYYWPYFVCLSCASDQGDLPQPCEWCARSTFAYGRRVLCSKRCEAAFYRKANSSSVVSCATCKQPFAPKRADAKHCSPACKQKAYRQRKKVTD
jgi:hypothetical protein